MSQSVGLNVTAMVAGVLHPPCFTVQSLLLFLVCLLFLLVCINLCIETYKWNKWKITLQKYCIALLFLSASHQLGTGGRTQKTEPV